MFKRNQLVAIDVPEFKKIVGPKRVTYVNKEYFRIEGSDIRWSQKNHKLLTNGSVSEYISFFDGLMYMGCPPAIKEELRGKYTKYWNSIKIYPYNENFEVKKETYDNYTKIMNLIRHFDFVRFDLAKSLGTKSKQKQLKNILQLLEKVEDVWPKK